MTFSIYHNAQNDRQYKAGTGLSQAAFEVFYQLFAPYYEPKVSSPYPNQAKPVLTDKREALFFILHCYKAYPTLQNIGLYFGFSDFAASVYLERLKPCLKAALRSQGIDKSTLFKNQVEFDQQFAGVTDLVIDVTEVPIERAGNQEIQREYYSGKKKLDTVKCLLIGTLDRRLLWVSKMYSGRTHDFRIYKDVFAGINLKNYRIHVDAGFVGIKKFSECGFVFIPFKARKGYPLTPFERVANQILAHFRVAIENVIAKMKVFFILRTENRMRKKEKLADAFSLCAELADFKNSYATC